MRAFVNNKIKPSSSDDDDSFDVGEFQAAFADYMFVSRTDTHPCSPCSHVSPGPNIASLVEILRSPYVFFIGPQKNKYMQYDWLLRLL